MLLQAYIVRRKIYYTHLAFVYKKNKKTTKDIDKKGK